MSLVYRQNFSLILYRLIFLIPHFQHGTILHRRNKKNMSLVNYTPLHFLMFMIHNSDYQLSDTPLVSRLNYHAPMMKQE